MRRFKQMIEAGEVATTQGQPSGRVEEQDDAEKADRAAEPGDREGTEQ
jgi:hypothetical protein